MKWFKHDSDAHSDARLLKVKIKYGMEGFGLYFYCLELIAGGVSENNITFELEHDAEVIAHETGIHYERVQEMMTYMVDLGLFENNAGTITCFRLAKRLDQSMTSNPQMRKLIADVRENHDSVMIKSAQIRLDKIRLDKNIGRKRAPKDYEPSTELMDSLSAETNIGVPDLLALLREMKDHEFKSAKKDWDAVFRNWVRRSAKWRKDEAHKRTESYEDILAKNRALAGLD